MLDEKMSYGRAERGKWKICICTPAPLLWCGAAWYNVADSSEASLTRGAIPPELRTIREGEWNLPLVAIATPRQSLHGTKTGRSCVCVCVLFWDREWVMCGRAGAALLGPSFVCFSLGPQEPRCTKDGSSGGSSEEGNQRSDVERQDDEKMLGSCRARGNKNKWQEGLHELIQYEADLDYFSLSPYLFIQS